MTFLSRTAVTTALTYVIFMLLTGAVRAESPAVAVSIAPLHSLIAGVMDGVGSPALIVKGSASPHAYSLKPSDARTLGRARLVFWVGPAMELFLEKPLQSLSGTARIVTLMDIPALHLLENDSQRDPHIWLDPANAAVVVAVAAHELSALDPDNAERYRHNAAALSRRLQGMAQDIRRRLAPVASVPLLVFHDAYAYFAEAFRLNVVSAVVISPERPPGAARVAAIRTLIKENKVRCLFREPQLQSRLLDSLITDADDVKVAVLDPLGAGLTPGKDLYFDLMEMNARSVERCADN